MRIQDYFLVSANETGEGIPVRIRQMIADVINGDRKTYRYMMFVGLLVAVTDRRLHPRCLQLKAKCNGAFDARSLCKNVVVPFEKTYLKGRLGGSCDPYVSNPARLPMIDLSNDVKGSGDAETLRSLYDVLEYVRKADADKRRVAFCYAFSLVQKRPGEESFSVCPAVDADGDVKVGALFDFLYAQTQGVGAVAVLAAYIRGTMPKNVKVEVHQITESGASPQETGDIDVVFGTERRMAVEVKDKPYTAVDVGHACRKALKGGVKKVVFAFGPAAERKRPHDGALMEYWEEKGVDLSFLSIESALSVAMAVSDRHGRIDFADRVFHALSDMNAPDSARRQFESMIRKKVV